MDRALVTEILDDLPRHRRLVAAPQLYGVTNLAIRSRGVVVICHNSLEQMRHRQRMATTPRSDTVGLRGALAAVDFRCGGSVDAVLLLSAVGAIRSAG